MAHVLENWNKIGLYFQKVINFHSYISSNQSQPKSVKRCIFYHNSVTVLRIFKISSSSVSSIKSIKGFLIFNYFFITHILSWKHWKPCSFLVQIHIVLPWFPTIDFELTLGYYQKLLRLQSRICDAQLRANIRMICLMICSWFVLICIHFSAILSLKCFYTYEA